MTTTLQYEIFAAFIAALGVLVGLYMYYRYNRSHLTELAQRENASIVEDRAYNQIQLGKAAADRLGRTGVDVSEARAFLDRAEASRKSGAYPAAIEQAKQAQDLLAAARAGSAPAAGISGGAAGSSGGASAPPVTSPPLTASPAGPGPLISAGGVTSGSSGAFGRMEEPVPAATPSKAPRNKMEAHFQLSLAQDELDKAHAIKPVPKTLREADSLLTQGQAAYDKEDFTEALRLALKSRRALGTRVESLPVRAAPPAASGTTPSAAVDTSEVPSAASSEPSFGQKCPKCGRTAAPSDQFCRGCGTPIPPSLCSNCGSPLLSGDRFCGKCGAVQA